MPSTMLSIIPSPPGAKSGQATLGPQLRAKLLALSMCSIALDAINMGTFRGSGMWTMERVGGLKVHPQL